MPKCFYKCTHFYLFLSLSSYNSSIPLLYEDSHPDSLHSHLQFIPFPPLFPAFPPWFPAFPSFPPWLPAFLPWFAAFPSRYLLIRMLRGCKFLWHAISIYHLPVTGKRFLKSPRKDEVRQFSNIQGALMKGSGEKVCLKIRHRAVEPLFKKCFSLYSNLIKETI